MPAESIEDFYAVSQIGGAFLAYGVREMLRLIRPAHNLDNEIMYWMLYSAANRHDRRTVFMYLRDWDTGATFRREVTRFRPGTHWHALDRKFSTYSAAVAYIESQGYAVGGFRESYAPKEGD